jgi:2-polyprenyl-3-methyl-5-hydroxy-6-metoxy-1,4-benzoquinol methylase
MKNKHLNRWTDHEVESHWDNVADIYVRENERVKTAHNQRFLESIYHIKLMPGMKVLNISSRDAGAEDYLTKQEPDCQIIHAEISAGLMRVAQKIRPGINQVKINGYSDLPFSNGEFHRILTLETLEHVADPVRFLQELSRVSTPDARMVLSCPPATSELPYRFYTFLFGGHGEGPHRFLRSKEVKDMLADTGWKLIAHKGTILIPVGPAWLQMAGEKFMDKVQGSFLAEMGIRQFYICEKSN